MPNYQAITKNQHGSKRWLRFTSYAHAENEAIMPLSVPELPKAMMSLPVCFIQQGDDFFLAAVLNIKPGKNLLVGTNGQWVGPYVPAACRSFPFILAKTPEGQTVLCIDEDAGMVTEGPEGEPFFEEDGEPAKAIMDVMGFLNQLEQGRLAAAASCAVLAKHQLIQPWPIMLKSETGETAVEGLFRVDETALNQLSAEALLEVRDAGGLNVAYCQLLSMQHLSTIGKLAEMHANAAAQAAKPTNISSPPGELNLDFLNKSETISLGGLS